MFAVTFDNGLLTIQCEKGRHNLIRVLDYIQKYEISFGRVDAKLPTLNDVFLELTGKELRDDNAGGQQ